MENSKNKRLIVAIDGTSASGKGTLAKKIASYYQIPHLDTGKLYRAVALTILLDNGEKKIGNEEEVARYCGGDIEKYLNDERITSEEVGKLASIIAGYPKVRNALIKYQRDFAYNPNNKGAVLDGRDIGSVICPDATIKFFVSADLQIRTERRLNELKNKGILLNFDEVYNSLSERDERDKNREIAPLIILSDAIILDSSDKKPNELLEIAVSNIDKIFCPAWNLYKRCPYKFDIIFQHNFIFYWN